MNEQGYWRMERAAGLFLVLAFVTNIAGVVMFSIRDGAGGGAPPSHTFFVWERGFFMAAVVLTAIGFVLLEEHLRSTHGYVLARTGATTYLFAGILVVVAEGLILSAGLGGQQVLALINIYVVLAFLGQAAIGGAVLQSRALPAWIGWATMIWNIACLVTLPLITPHDIWFPVLHHFLLPLIGVPLLRSAPLSQSPTRRIGRQEAGIPH